MDDSLRAVLDSVFASPVYDWEERTDPFAFLRRWVNFLIGSLVRWGSEHPTALKLLFWILAGVVVLLLARVALAVLRGFRATREHSAPLVAPVTRDARWFRREAERLGREGRLLEAMQADFTALILEFDRRRLVRYHPSKTPQEYVREASLSPPARAELGDLVWGLYRHLFAHEPVSPSAAAAWRARTSEDRYAPG